MVLKRFLGVGRCLLFFPLFSLLLVKLFGVVDIFELARNYGRGSFSHAYDIKFVQNFANFCPKVALI